mgnify:CR=1 FL=1
METKSLRGTYTKLICDLLIRVEVCDYFPLSRLKRKKNCLVHPMYCTLCVYSLYVCCSGFTQEKKKFKQMFFKI